MTDYDAWKKRTVRYWERRRIAFNAMLLPPTFVGYVLTGELSAAMEDKARFGFGGVLALLLVCAIGANFCFSLVYAGEFLFGSEDESSGWMRSGRNIVFVAGTLLSMALAMACARNIGVMQYSPQFPSF